ncbi:MAG: inositol monophosphatase [Paraprevotella sp.]|nr:inositol monophosphatase [Paraprevotella sp.]
METGKVLDLDRLTEEVKTLAVSMGHFLKKERLSFDRNRVEQKGAHDYVSYVDRTSERMIVERLHDLCPEAGFITEEGTGSLEDQEYCWVVDPLDGTSNYIHDHVPYCVSIALRNRKEILLGVVFECGRDELFWAHKGAEAYLNDRVIHVSDQAVLDQSFIELGLPYKAVQYKPFALEVIASLYGRVGGLRLAGAAAAELCYIAAGRFEARIEGFIGPWDIAAGSIILKQAGGRMTDFSGNPDCFDAREVFASNGKIHEELLKVLQSHKKLLEN